MNTARKIPRYQLKCVPHTLFGKTEKNNTLTVTWGTCNRNGVLMPSSARHCSNTE